MELTGERLAEGRMTVTTGSPVHGGYALARPEGMGVLFVRWALPGEVVLVRLVERKRSTPSPRRWRSFPPRRTEWTRRARCSGSAGDASCSTRTIRTSSR